MIAIINRGGDTLGACKYEVKINTRHIAFFEHNRADGLTKCLELAAKAVEKAKWMEAAELINAVTKGDKVDIEF